jgi:HlyD family secretion protein
MNKTIKTALSGLSIFLLVVAAAATWWLNFYQEPLPEGLIQANGRIEGDHYSVASKFPGRVAELKAREGDEVDKGQVLARLDDTQINAKVVQAEKGVVAADAQCSAAEASEQQSRRDKIRLQNLLKSQTASRQEAERTTLAWRVEKERLAAAKAQCGVAKAVLQEVQSIQADLTIRAPASGMITTRMVDLGEVVAAGSPLFDIVDLDRLYLKVYIPEKAIGKVRLGLAARIYTDAFPDNPFTATVRYIASQAEFTPKEVQTPDERVKLVYAVKLYLDENPDHRLSPGLPADTVIRWQEGVEWVNPSW